MVPKEWVTKDLRSISLLITKGSTPTTYGHEFVEQSENSIRFVGAYNCSFDGKFKSDSEKWISKEADELLKRSKLNDKDCIICIVGNTIGSNFLVSKEIIPANINQNVAIIRADERKVNSRYLHYWIMSPYIQYQVQQEASTQAQPSLSLKQVGDFTIALPPLNEQKRIAKILSTWDKAISTTEQLLTNSQQQKKALMQQLLTGKKRLLDKHGVRFSEEWKPTTLSKMGKIVSGGTPDTCTREFWDGGINWLTPTDVTALKSRFVLSTARTISDAGVKNSSATLLPAGSLMVCTRATIGTLAISKMATCTNQGFKNIVPSKNFDVNFIYYSLLYNTKELVRKASGSTFLELSKKDFENIELPCPLLEEQQKIATILSTADQEISALQQKLDALKQEKKALMQQLLTGKRRVKVEVAV